MSVSLRNLFAQPALLWLLAALPLLGLLSLWARRRRRRALALMGSGVFFHGVVARRRRLRAVRFLCLFFGLILLVVGTAGPQWGREWGQSAAPGRDLVVVLDLSRSMLAEQPSRLERARRAVLDLADAVEQRGGHRLALVGFAGKARLLCPLTHDYTHFREVVSAFHRDRLDPSLWPDPDAPSGTRIGEGLRVACAAHDEGFEEVQDILLISDGHDPAGDDEWKAGATAAALRGIPVHVVGVGDPKKDRPIPFDEDHLFHDGDKVLTRLKEAPLEQIARRTKGTYTALHTGAYSLGDLFFERIAPGEQREHGADALPVYRPRFVWFLAPAFALLCLTLLIGDGRRAGSVV